MIKRNQFIFALAAIFLLLSGIGYLIHYLIFRDVHHIFLYLIGDLAFLPLEVLLVTVVLSRVIPGLIVFCSNTVPDEFIFSPSNCLMSPHFAP